MRTKLFLTLPILASLLVTGTTSWAQGTVEDYQRAYTLQQRWSSAQVLHGNIVPQWIEGSECFWYADRMENGVRYMKADAALAEQTELFNTEALAALLSQQLGKTVEATSLSALPSLQHLRVNPTADTLRFAYDGREWTYLPESGRLFALHERPRGFGAARERHWMEVDPEQDERSVPSPDGSYVAFIRDNNVWIRSNADGHEQRLSQDGTPGNYYSSHLYWSPDSRRVATCRIRPAAETRYVYYVESSPANQLQPRLHKQEYAKPGDELRFKVPCIFSIDGTETVQPSTELFAQQFDLVPEGWTDDGDAFTFVYNERGHKVFRLLELSATDGNVRIVAEEKEEKYVNYPIHYHHQLTDGKRLIWSSERDNYNHLYLYDRTTGKPIRQITCGEWYVREVQYVDEEREQIYFSANGMNLDEDPYFIYYYRIDFDGKGLTCLTPDKGNHRAWYSPNHSYLVDVYSQIDVPPVAVVRQASDGDVVMEVAKADISALLAEGWQAPEAFSAKGRDGETDVWGIIYRPSNFDPSHTYPVIEYIYSGPGNQYVPKSFSAYNNYMTALAELGFIVVQVDGMTTSFRSKAFEEVCYKNLQDAGLPDHMAWLRAAAEAYPYIDLDRVGIFGCSAGGQEAMAAVLAYPEFYKAAYAACGCHDNRMDKVWWNELWMGYPVDSSYVAASNVENAHLLSRPLMLLVGEIDDNVDPASTMQVADALIKAGKDFELVVIPGAHHTMGEAFGEHKRFDFFVRHLMGVNPPTWDEVAAQP